MCLVITINDKGVNVIDVEWLRIWIKEANFFSQWNTSCVPTRAPIAEPAVLASGGAIVVRQFIHSCAPFLNLAR
jgi:hypothetical protein